VTETGSGSGDAVVLVHGWPDTHRVWREQIPVLAEAGYRVVAYDQRGFGESDRPSEVSGSHVFHAMVDIRSILDALDIDSAHVVGHDWGAPPCWLFAMFSPDRVRTLVPLSVGHPHAFRNAGMEQQEKSFYMLLFQFVDIAEQWLSADEWANMKTLIGDL
jgi:pimeloyl-ACP methyl ester carboxylesterase